MLNFILTWDKINLFCLFDNLKQTNKHFIVYSYNSSYCNYGNNRDKELLTNFYQSYYKIYYTGEKEFINQYANLIIGFLPTNSKIEGCGSNTKIIQLRNYERVELEYIYLSLGLTNILSLPKYKLRIFNTLNKEWLSRYDILKKELDTVGHINNLKPYFCCFIVSNPKCIERNIFFELIQKHIGNVHSLGKWKKNIDIIIPERVKQQDEYLNLLSKYKYMITFENTSKDYYHTEKIWNALRAGTVPIYWGDPLITQVFDKDCFLHIPTHNKKNKQFTEFMNIITKLKKEKDDNNIYLNYFRNNIVLDADIEDSRLQNTIQTISNL